ncbi:SCO7613 C-terminal domain-containing membrane protein [Streptomyces sp. NPDC058869]|uniref:SCO7613 C-terminal domain-containing membrane protein n=1 Tax=Streptomyces sp. NPDC058869 TaxID=3346659 RepID=UPI003696600C
MEHVLPPAEELARLDRELAELEARRARLLTRRAWLLAALRPPAPSAAPGWNPSAWGAPGTGRPDAPARPWGSVPPKGPSAPRGAQNVLLTLGGLLLTVAAIAFTLVSWGSMGIGGRSAVLALVTAGALAAPAVLLKRGLTATAEALTALALVLTLLDAYAVHAVAAPDTDGLGFTAGAAAVLAALWTGYGLALSRLRLPLPAAVVLAQWPLLFGAWAAGAPASVVGWALLATAVLDGAIALWGRGTGARVTACVGGSVMGASALLVGLTQSVTASGPLGALAPGALLLTAAAAALAGAWRAPRGVARAGGVVAGLAVVAAVGGVPAAALPEGWRVLAYVSAALALTAVVRTGLPGNAALGVLVASAAVVAGALAGALPGLAAVLLGPVTLLPDAWAGPEEGFRAALGSTLPWPELRAAPVVLAVTAALLGSAYRWWPSWARIAEPLIAREAPGSGATAAPGASGTPGAGVAAGATHGAGTPGAPDSGTPRAGGTAVPGAPGAAGAGGTPDPERPDAGTPVGAAAPGASGAPGTGGRAGAGGAAGAPAAAAPGTGAPWYAGGPAGAPWYTGGASAARGRPAAAALRGAAGAAAAVLGWGALLLAGAVLDVPYAVAVGGETVLVAGLLALAVHGTDGGRDGSAAVRGTALVVAPAGAVSAGLLSLASEGASYAVFGVLAALFAGAAVRARGGVPRTVFAVAATAGCTVLTGFAGRSLGLAPHEAAPLVLLVPALTVLLGAGLRRDPVAAPVELTGALGALVAVGLAVPDAPFLALVLALCGVLAAGAAVRPERRPVAGHLAAALFVLATWVRLGASEVSFPEAYTLPVTVPALVVGFLRRRKDPEASSWTAYGPGLAVTLLPSLAVAWTDPDWRRPLLLGVAALVITLLGARHRLQALLLLGGAVLALDGLHELAPYVVQVAGALPRWLPPALAGLLLLVVGATYEQRLRDARRLRDALGRMR